MTTPTPAAVLAAFDLCEQLENARSWANDYDPLKAKSQLARVNPRFLVALIEHAIATASTDRAMGAEGWQDIATAPKDGETRVLVARIGWAEQQAVCWWSGHYNTWITVAGGNHFVGATHWQPLPKPPSGATSAEG